MTKLLFLFGVGRSGTSALVNVLNSHPKILLGQERYFFQIRREDIVPEHFEKERFLDVRAEDTHKMGGLKGKDLSARYDEAVYVGDKFPSLFRHLDLMFERFPDAHYLYILRNPLSVVESYDARFRNPKDHWKHTWEDGIEAWNESVGKVSRLPEERLKSFTLVQYESLFSSAANINDMFADLGLPPVPEEKLARFVKKFNELNESAVPRNDHLRMNVGRRADWQAYRTLLERIER